MPSFDITAQSGPLIVTLVYIGFYYALTAYGLQVKISLMKEYKARGETFDRYFGQDRRMLAADRMQLNMLEHMPPFLMLLWLNALFIGPEGATMAGGIYVITRAIYPFLMGKTLGRGIPLRIFASTFTGYAVLIYFAGALIGGVMG